MQKFLLTWLVFVVVLVGLALIVDIDWAKPYCQTALKQIFHRNVRIGHLTWSFGMNGLEVETARLSVTEADGKTFLTAGKSDIGIDVLSLLTKKILVRHLNFEKPEIWALRTQKNTWNFDDLLVLGTDIRYIQLGKGTIHIRDEIPKSKAAWAPITVQDVKLKFVWPHKKKQTPVYLSFKIAKPQYSTTVDVSGIGSGELANWQENKYTFEANAHNLNPDDVVPFLRAVSDRFFPGTISSGNPEQMKGLFDLKVTASGTLTTGITAKVSAQARKFSFDAPVLGKIKAPAASSQANLTLDTKKLQWSDMVTRIANVEVRSHGTLSDWNKSDPQCTANLNSNISDLSVISDLVSTRKEGDATYVDPKRLNGEAQIEIKIVGSTNKPTMTTDVKSGGISVADFLEDLPKQVTPVVCLLGLSKTSKVQGEIKLVPNERVDITKGVIPVAGGTLETSGSANLKNDQAKFFFRSKGLSLTKAQKTLVDSAAAMTELKKMIYLKPPVKLQIGGFVDIDGVFENVRKGEHNTTGTANFKNAEFCLSDGTITAKHMNGQVKWTNNVLTIDNLTGTIGDGAFDMNGSASLRGDHKLDLKIHSTHLDLVQLNTLLKVLKVDLPLLTEHHLRGRVHDLVLNVTGTRSTPNIYFSTTPEDLLYQPTGMNKPLRARSGTIVYDKDVLTLQEVGFVDHNDKVITTLAIEDLSHQARVHKIRVKSSGIDLADVNYYLVSPMMPAPLKKLYVDFLAQYGLASVHGRIYGDAVAELNSDKTSRLDGLIGLVNAGAKVGKQRFPVEHVAGVLAASGAQLLIQDLTGSIRSSHFDMSGQINQYQTNNPSWQADLRASLEPRELLELLPALTDEIDKWKLKLTSTGPVLLKAKVKGNAESSEIAYSVTANANNQLSVSSLLGILHQPYGEPLSLDGTLTMNPTSISASNAQMSLGESLLHGSGSVNWTYKDANKTEIDMDRSEIQFSLKSPNAIPARKLIAMLDPTISKDVGGTVQGFVGMKGSLNRAKTNGKLELNKISIPKLDVKEVSGVIDMLDSAGKEQKALVEFSELEFGEFPLHKVKADLTMTPEDSNKQPKLMISKGQATYGGGLFNLDGWIDPNDHRLNIHTTISKAKAAALAEQLVGHSGELTGLVDADFKIDTEGNDYKEAISNLSGSGVVTVHNGMVTRFGQLQTKLTQANLLHQGLFGFNLNNLLQSMVPVRTGQFRELNGDFRMSKGILYVDQLTYEGPDMRLWGAGKANLPLNTLDLEMAGKIPRVSSSMIRGPFAKVSKDMTFQKVVNVMTMHQLENLPSLPVLGDLAADKPRSFSFKVISELDKPKTVSQSIEKSFHWLPPKPNASAHPVPGLAISQK